MTKKEYFNQLCKECKKGDTCTKRAFHYPEENACPKVLGVASQAWDAAVEQTRKWLTENAVDYISGRGMFLTALLDDYTKAMEDTK